MLIGKTNMLEFAYAAVHPDYGPALNPWNLSRSSSGSSSGSAVAVAAGMGYGSIGSDTGGSIRLPAAYCGIVGLKPTYGRVSRHGGIPVSWSADHFGPMTRTVAMRRRCSVPLPAKIRVIRPAAICLFPTMSRRSVQESRGVVSESLTPICGSMSIPWSRLWSVKRWKRWKVWGPRSKRLPCRLPARRFPRCWPS